MFCRNCGNEIRPGAAFCENCGAPVEYAQENSAQEDFVQENSAQEMAVPENLAPGEYEGENFAREGYAQGGYSPEGFAQDNYVQNEQPQSAKKSKKGLIAAISITAGIIIIAAVIVAIILFSRVKSNLESYAESSQDGSGYTESAAQSWEDVIGQCISAIQNADLAQMLSFVPESVLEAVLEEQGYTLDEIDEFLGEYNDSLSSAWSMIDLVLDDWELSYEVVSETEVTGTELSEIQETYGQYGVSVDSAVCAEISLIIIADGYDLDDMLDLDDLEFYFIESDGQWYLDFYSMDW